MGTTVGGDSFGTVTSAKTKLRWKCCSGVDLHRLLGKNSLSILARFLAMAINISSGVTVGAKSWETS